MLNETNLATEYPEQSFHGYETSDSEDNDAEDTSTYTIEEKFCKDLWKSENETVQLVDDHETMLWQRVKPRVEDVTKNIAHKIWWTDSRGWQAKVRNKSFDFSQLFELGFPASYFQLMKMHILSVLKPNEWEPSLLHLVQFVITEIAVSFYSISPTEYYRERTKYPLQLDRKLGNLALSEYLCILCLGNG